MKHELISSNIVLLFLVIIFSCVFSKEIFSQDLSGPYFGQTAPNLKAVRFSPERYSANDDWFWHGPLSFSPDGTEIYMTKYKDGDKMQLNWAKEDNGSWTLLKPFVFAGDGDKNNPIITADGEKLYFISNSEGGRFWTVKKTSDGWSELVTGWAIYCVSNIL